MVFALTRKKEGHQKKVKTYFNYICEKNTIVYTQSFKNGILLPKLFWPTVRKKSSSDHEKLLKFEAEGQEFAKFLR